MHSQFFGSIHEHTVKNFGFSFYLCLIGIYFNCKKQLLNSFKQTANKWKRHCPNSPLIKKENQIFLIYREIQSGAVAKSHMPNGPFILVYGEIFSHFLIY